MSEKTEIPEETIQDNASKLHAAEEIKSIVVNHLLGQGGLQLSKELQREEDEFNAVTYGALLEAGIDRDTDDGAGFSLVSRARRHLSRLELLEGILAEVSSNLKEKIESARQQVDRMGSVCGLASLPPDILVQIFSITINSSSRKVPRSRHSVRLSHVCRHFWHIITTNPLFWNEISATPYAPEIGLINASLQRSKDCPLDIHLNTYTYPVIVRTHDVPPDAQHVFPNGIPELIEGISSDQSLSALIPHTHRWRSLLLNFVNANSSPGTHTDFSCIVDPTFPMLKTLVAHRNYFCGVYQHRFPVDNHFNREMGFMSSWITPALQTLRVRECYPHSLSESSLASITKFDVTLTSFDDMISLFPTLPKMKSVKEFCVDTSHMDFYGGAAYDAELLELENVDLGSVMSFTFRLKHEQMTRDKEDKIRYFQIILSKLGCPNTTHLTFEAWRSDYPKDILSLHQFLSFVPSRFSKVIDYKVSIRKRDAIYRGGSDVLKSTSLPIHFPPNLHHFTFICDTPILFSGAEDAYEMPPSFSKLRTLTLALAPSLDSDSRSAIVWVRWIVEQCQLHSGSEPTFEQIQLLKCAEKNRSCGYELEKIIPRDEVVAWCRSEMQRQDDKLNSRGSKNGIHISSQWALHLYD
ncbi:hypothetical protein SCHPADRAFT_1000140 [Schizopora paradoxa]|uniref:Uncharacterized protein n=1 Tax=Schizopora paradoxa TaxID=27342 RepID=A0A0H2RCX3_9AGAM|nr:hypothetical protein SCHPADRAFT_1000140 [Schizopora paradoxa]